MGNFDSSSTTKSPMLPKTRVCGSVGAQVTMTAFCIRTYGSPERSALVQLSGRRIVKGMSSRSKCVVFVVALSGIGLLRAASVLGFLEDAAQHTAAQSSLLSQSMRTLPTALRSFDQEHDLAKKEQDLLSITQRYPNAGPALLHLAESTRSTDTRWMAMRGMRDVHFAGCARFLDDSLRSPDVLVRSNAARVIGDLGFRSAVPDLLTMFVAEQDPGAVEQASLPLKTLRIKAAVPSIRAKLPLFTGQTRLWLLQALGSLGDRSDVPAIAGYLEDPDWVPQDIAATALEELTGVSFGPTREGPTSLPTLQTLRARAWWNQHRESWPDCSDCPKK
ncbi:hypothetical protein GRAN_5037 [Granulicella sibirica]|uniref:HEAT repeat domain-containing protein n=1 Tax=Granulicella sibirica TaxID=2479048 RepID=A0A4Q0SWW7_9BACT|nr:hypothetical protein GRAN_5037 [Granulicella sibirica]